MGTEIRRIGRDRLALYTDEEWIYERFHKWHDTLCEVPYLQDNKPVAVDLYFDRKVKRIITRVLKGQLMLDI
ncbi:hypothetical protein ACFLV3_01705 [Chloroflexota bacterium]